MISSSRPTCCTTFTLLIIDAALAAELLVRCHGSYRRAAEILLSRPEGLRLDWSVLFKNALQRVLLLACKVEHLADLGACNVVRIQTAHPNPVIMDFKHDPFGSRVVLVEYALQHVNDERHGRVVIVQQQHFGLHRSRFGEVTWLDLSSAPGRPIRLANAMTDVKRCVVTCHRLLFEGG